VEAIGLGADRPHITSRIILPHADLDSVLHHHAQHFTETVCTLGLITPLCHHADHMPTLQQRDAIVASLFAQAINDASIIGLCAWCQRKEIR
jgi:hypothetical protein